MGSNTGKTLLRNDRGVALVIALLLVLVATLIGISAIGTTVFEANITGNERVGTGAFYAAEAGLHVGIDQLPDTTPFDRTSVGNESYYWSGTFEDLGSPKGFKSFGLHQKGGYDTTWGFKRYQINATGESFRAVKEVEAQVSLGPYASGTQYNN